MYRIVKSDTVELSSGMYIIQERKPERPTRKKTQAPPTSEDNTEMPEDTLQEETAEEQEWRPEYAPIDAELKRIAEQQAEAILLDAAQRAQDSYLDTMRRAEVDAAALREEAVQQGRTEGIRAQVEHVRSCIAQVEQAVVRMESEQAAFQVEYEQKLKWLALEIASKVLAKKLDEDDTIMVELVRSAVSGADDAKSISVEISDSMPGLLQELQNCFVQNEAVEVRTVPAPAGTCRVETAEGVVDASVYTQIENLKDYFASEPPE